METRALPEESLDLLKRLLEKHQRSLTHLVREADALSQPCPEGRWRWAGPHPVPGMAEKAQGYRAELKLTESLMKSLEEELCTRPSSRQPGT